MDRRLPVLLTLIVLCIVGCSREKAPPPQAVAAPVKAEMIAPEVSSAETNQQGTSAAIGGVGFSGSGLGSGTSASRVSDSSVTSDLFAAGSPPTAPPASAAVFPPPPPADPAAPATDLGAAVDAQRQQELAQRAQAEAARRRALEELQGASVLGALGSASGRSGEAPHPLAPSDTLDKNPLRASVLPPAPPESNRQNPLRQARREPRIPTISPSERQFTPAPPSGEIAPGSGLPFLDNSPSGGSAPPTFGAAPPSAFNDIQPSDTKAQGADRALIGGGAAPPTKTSPPRAEPLPPSTAEDDQFDVVEVLYGTDRLASEKKASDWTHLLLQFLPTLIVSLLAVFMIFYAARQRSWLLASVATVGLGACLLLGCEAIDEILLRIRGATKIGPRYTTDRAPDGRIELGRCEVTVPKTHAVGELESPSIFRLEISEDISRHLVLQKTEQLASPKFYDLLRHRVEQSSRRELFVFVHGFNVSFEDAARRTAQIHYDLKFDGAPIFFSWPANDKFIFTYPADEINVSWSVPHLKQFLLEIVKESRAQSINLIAHSMGNRALAAALREIQLELHDQARLFNQVILAAPDIDADDFRNNIAPAMQRTARGLTLYASSHDEALLASQFIHRGPRAGDAGEGLTVIAGVDTIDVTAIDQSFFGHSYYGSSHPVLNDLRALLSGAIPPRDRTWLSPAERDGLTYWIFQPARTAAAESNLNR